MIQAKKNKQMAKGAPSYATPNQLAAAIILADPERYLGWPEPLSVEEIEASLMVGWARKVTQVEEQVSDKK